MEKGVIHIYAGEEKSGFGTAIGKAVLEAAQGKHVMIIRFLKEELSDSPLLRRLEPELKLFDFHSNIFNGMNFAKKILTIEECDLLVLCDMFELLEKEVISMSDIRHILDVQGGTDVVLTGRKYNSEIVPFLSVDSPRFECYDISMNKIK